MSSILNWLLLRMTWWMLRAVRACNPALRQPFAQTLSKHDFTVVIWPTRNVPSPWRLRATLHMSMAKLSTWSSRRWRLSQTLVTPGKPGVEAGILEQDASTGIIGGTIDLFAGSTVAMLLRLIPGLTHSQALRLLASPSQLPSWIIEQITLPTLRR